MSVQPANGTSDDPEARVARVLPKESANSRNNYIPQNKSYNKNKKTSHSEGEVNNRLTATIWEESAVGTPIEIRLSDVGEPSWLQ